jgi:DNA polymerase-3 subunit delta
MFEFGKDVFAVPCYDDDKETSKRIARQFFADRKISCSERVLDYISDNAIGDRGSLMNDLDKIDVYVGASGDCQSQKTITENDILNLLFETKEIVANDLVDAIATKQLNIALSKCEDLLHSDVDAIVIVKSLITHFIQLKEMVAEIYNGNNIDLVLKSHKVFFKRIGSYRKQLSMWKEDSIGDVLVLLADLEIAVKAFSANDSIVDSVIKKFVMQVICGSSFSS